MPYSLRNGPWSAFIPRGGYPPSLMGTTGCCRCSAGAPPERSDAARNRELLLGAARRLVERCGVRGRHHGGRRAIEAGVGKGTVFRRFDNRAGLMAALLNHFESAWQAAVISGPPPLGPGAPPLDRLLAFGRSRIALNLQHAGSDRGRGPRRSAARTRRTRSLPRTCGTCSRNCASPATCRCWPPRCWHRSRW